MLLWWALTTRCNFGGNWTGLFFTGTVLEPPPALASERIYRFPNSAGYDGQFYHYMAHDPVFREGLANYIDAPRLRCRRILVPGLAYLAAGGRSRFIDPAYFAVMLGFLFLGTYWMSALAQSYGRHPAWGLLFMVTPCAIASIDNMSVDVALAALTLGAVWYSGTGRLRPLVTVLVLAPLARETGLLLVAAFVLAAMWKREWKRAALFAAAAVPAVAWQFFVFARTGPVQYETSFVPFAAVWRAIVEPVRYQGYPPALAWTGMALQYVALAGAVLATALAFRAFEKGKPADGAAITAMLFALLSVFLQRPDVWQSVYGFGRIFAPLYLVLALRGLAMRSWAWMLPLLMMAPRTAMQLGPQLAGIVGCAF